MRHLITGGAGFIGSHLADALVTDGDEVLVLDDLSTGRLTNIDHLVEGDAVEFIEGSVTDERLVDRCVAAVDSCFHLASAVGVQLIVNRPLDTLLRNTRGNDIVLATVARHKRPTVFTSTSEVYGKNSSGALTESSDRLLGSPFISRWSYAEAKAVGEALAHSYHREQGSPITVARLFNTVGPRQSSVYGMVLPRFIRQAIADEDITVFGSGEQTRCFVHVHDTVRALAQLARTPEARGDVFNVGSSTEVSIIELALRVMERSGSGSRLVRIPYTEAYEEGFEELGRRRPDTTKLRELSGWAPLRTLDDAIDDVLAYEKGHREVPALEALVR